MSAFQNAVIRTVKNIPRGSTMTYSEVASRAGFSGAARAVGSLMRKNTGRSIPCHRVVGVSGLGAYNGLRGTSKKETLLAEGVVFK